MQTPNPNKTDSLYFISNHLDNTSRHELLKLRESCKCLFRLNPLWTRSFMNFKVTDDITVQVRSVADVSDALISIMRLLLRRNVK